MLDIETAPTIAYVWGLWKVNVGINQIIQPTFMISWSAKWLGEKKVHYRGLGELGRAIKPEDEKRLLPSLHKLLNEADLVVTHNGNNFDLKHIDAAFLRAGMQPTLPYRSVDTLREVKVRFKFLSNRLDYLLTTLSLSEKMENEGFELWSKCMAGQRTAWRTMERYNKKDVTILEELYLRLRPFMKNHPNLAVYEDGEEMVCVCGSKEFRNKGYYYTNLSKFTRHQCKKCGAPKRGFTNLLTKEKRKNLLRNAL
jgi:hypothetical protein